jgi:signal transduction histidine kinase
LRPLIDALRRGETLRNVDVELPGVTRRIFSFSCAPILDALGAPTSGVIVFRDVTGRREAERFKDQALTTVSRELKTALSRIEGQVDALASQAASADAIPVAAVKERAKAILAQVNDAGRLLNLVPLSHAQADPIELHVTPRDLCEAAPAAGGDLIESE